MMCQLSSIIASQSLSKTLLFDLSEVTWNDSRVSQPKEETFSNNIKQTSLSDF